MTSHNLHIAHARLCLLCFFKERIKKENYIVVSVSYFFLLYYPKFSGWNYLITLFLTGWLNNVDLSWVGSVEPSHFSYQLLSHEVDRGFHLHSHIWQLENQVHLFPSTCLVILQQILFIHLVFKFSTSNNKIVSMSNTFQASTPATFIKIPPAWEIAWQIQIQGLLIPLLIEGWDIFCNLCLSGFVSISSKLSFCLPKDVQSFPL